MRNRKASPAVRPTSSTGLAAGCALVRRLRRPPGPRVSRARPPSPMPRNPQPGLRPRVQAAGEHGPDGRKLSAKQRLSKRGKPGAEEPPKTEAAKGEAVNEEPRRARRRRRSPPRSRAASPRPPSRPARTSLTPPSRNPPRLNLPRSNRRRRRASGEHPGIAGRPGSPGHPGARRAACGICCRYQWGAGAGHGGCATRGRDGVCAAIAAVAPAGPPAPPISQ